jgi:hypothetical protein
MLARFEVLVVAVFAVSLSAACVDSMPEDTVPMDGSVACYDKTCSSGQLCSSCPGAPDGSTGPSGYCHDVPAGCSVVECAYGECPTCLDLCGSNPGTVTGRTLGCPCMQ